MKKYLLSIVSICLCLGQLKAAEPDNAIDNESSTLNSIVEITPNKERNAILLKVGDVTLELSSNKGQKERTKQNLESNIKDESKKSICRLHKYDGRFALIELGFNQFVDPNYSSYTIETPEFLDLDVGRSMQVNIHLLEFGVSMGKNDAVGLSSGLRLVCNNYVFADDAVTISSGSGHIEPDRIVEQPCKKSKMTTFGIGVPLALDINLGDFYLSGGAWGEVILESYTKTKFPKVKDNLRYVNPFQYGVFAKFGYNNIYFYGNYALSDVFEAGKGPATNTASIGIGFLVK